MTRAERLADLGFPPEVDGKPWKVYVGTPYTCLESPAWVNVRFETANIVSMALINAGLLVFSPISHAHPIALTRPDCLYAHSLWLRQDEAFMDWADILVVFTQPGWEKSAGLTYEIEYFVRHLKPVLYLSPEALFRLDLQTRKESTPCLTSQIS